MTLITNTNWKKVYVRFLHGISLNQTESFSKCVKHANNHVIIVWEKKGRDFIRFDSTTIHAKSRSRSQHGRVSYQFLRLLISLFHIKRSTNSQQWNIDSFPLTISMDTFRKCACIGIMNWKDKKKGPRCIQHQHSGNSLLGWTEKTCETIAFPSGCGITSLQ